MPKEPANGDQKQMPKEEHQQDDMEKTQKDAAEKREDEGGYQ